MSQLTIAACLDLFNIIQADLYYQKMFNNVRKHINSPIRLQEIMIIL